MSKTKIFLEQTPQLMLNIIEALTFYRDNAVVPKFRELITKQINMIYDQLAVQKIEIFINNNVKSQLNFGEEFIYENEPAIVVGLSEQEGFVKIATILGNKFNIIDIPSNLLKKKTNNNLN